MLGTSILTHCLLNMCLIITDKIGPTMAVLRQDVYQNIKVQRKSISKNFQFSLYLIILTTYLTFPLLLFCFLIDKLNVSY